MSEILNVSDAPLVDVDEFLRGCPDAARTVLFAGGQEIAPQPMLWDCPLPAVTSPHLSPAPAADADLYTVRDVVVGGYGVHAVKDGAYVVADGVYPGYINMYFELDINPEYWGVRGEIVRRLDVAISINHFNLIYGHWLMEILPKVFLLRRMRSLWPEAPPPIVCAADTPIYMRDVLARLLPWHSVVTYERDVETVAVGRLILPGMLNRHYVYNPLFNEALDWLGREVSSWKPSPTAIFVSRKGLTNSTYRTLENATEIEALAAKLGMTVMHPEKLNWFKQVRLFSKAKLLVGEFGSGLHNAVFASGETRVVPLNWIVEVQSRIANLRGQKVGYILPSDGQPRGFTLEPQTEADGTYRIDPDEFAARVGPLVKPARSFFR